MAVERNGYPIRLIQDSGNVIELMANRIDMNVTRKTGGKPMPFTGSSRYSMDLNLNKAMITIQGVFVDDNIPTGGSRASTVIDFSKTVSTNGSSSESSLAGPKSGGWYGTGSNLQYLFQMAANTGNEKNDIECELTKRKDASAGRYFVPTADVIRSFCSIRSLVDGELKSINFKSANNTSTPRTDTTAYNSSPNDATVNVDFSGNYATGYADDLIGENNSLIPNHQPAYSKTYKASWDHQAPYAYNDGTGANIRTVKMKESVNTEIHVGQIIVGAGIPTNTTVVSKTTYNNVDYIRLSADPTLSAGNGTSSWGDLSLSQYRGVTPETLATGVAAAINGKLSAHFSAEVVEVEDEDNNKMNGGVRITQVMNGSVDETYSVIPNGQFFGYLYPSIEPYTGGKSDIQKSAGDKVQDLWGVINNSRPADTIQAPTLKWSKISDNWRDNTVGEWIPGFKSRKKGDYIVGLQLPYNSMVQSSDTGMYVPRNFLVPVGKVKHGLEEGSPQRPFGNKGSEENNEPANVEFSKSGFTTGIQGTVTKFDISYDAGENVYVFTMIFAPINRML